MVVVWELTKRNKRKRKYEQINFCRPDVRGAKVYIRRLYKIRYTRLDNYMPTVRRYKAQRNKQVARQEEFSFICEQTFVLKLNLNRGDFHYIC